MLRQCHFLFYACLFFLWGLSFPSDAQTAYEWVYSLPPQKTFITALGLRSEDNLLVSGTEDGEIIGWDLNGGQKTFELKGHNGKISHLEFSPDGQMLASAAYDGTIRIWQFNANKLISQFELSGEEAYEDINGNEPTFVVFHPAGEKIYFGGYNGIITEGHIEQGHQKNIFTDPQFGITCGFLSEDYRQLYWGSGQYLYQYDFMKKQIIRKLSQSDTFDDYICEITPYPNVPRLAAWTYGGEVITWDIETGRKIKTIRATSSKGSSNIAFSSDGQYLLSGNKGSSVLLWDLEKGKVKQVLEKHHKAVTCFAFSKDDEYIITGGNDRMIIVWKQKKAIIPSPEVPKKLKERPVDLQKQIYLDNDRVELAFWDDKKVDGDTISVYLNGQLIVEKLGLMAEKHLLKVSLPYAKNHLIVYAHNEGKIPPNTIALRISDGSKNQYVTLKSSTKTNAAIELLPASQ